MSSLARDDRNNWQAGAACQGEHGVAFYPPLRNERKAARVARERRAKAVCRSCPVRSDCLDHALQAGERYGIWGGLNELERRNLPTAG